MEDFERENEKNIYVIRRKLSTYGMLKGEESWTMNIGSFVLHIKLVNDDFWRITNNLANREAVVSCKIIDFEKFDIDLFEDYSKRDPALRNYVYINRDPRFKNHLPIQYNVIETPTGGRINQSDGKSMPLLHLCELIKHLHRLSNLAVFA